MFSFTVYFELTFKFSIPFYQFKKVKGTLWSFWLLVALWSNVFMSASSADALFHWSTVSGGNVQRNLAMRQHKQGDEGCKQCM